jgi:RNA polymerase sigma-70 factor (ECF subfamily)
MTDASLIDVLEKLGNGDQEAVAKVFRAYEPHLRQVVRRQIGADLRSKFDSVDIVQSVFSDLLQGFRKGDWTFESADRLKAFLVTATRHRLLDRARRHRKAVEKEDSEKAAYLEDSLPANQPRPSQFAEARELWERLLSECPPNHREILRLKREGHTAVEIAASTGMHEDSIRRIMRDLACRLATRK